MRCKAVKVGRLVGVDDVASECGQLELDAVFNGEPVKLMRIEFVNLGFLSVITKFCATFYAKR